MRRFIANSLWCLGFWLLAASSALGQAGPNWSPTGQTFLAVTSSMANVALPALGSAVVLDNSAGSVAVCYALGGSSVTASVSGSNCGAGSYLLPAGQVRAFSRGSQTTVAAITVSGSVTLGIQTGNGSFQVGGSSVGGTSGGLVTIGPGTNLIGAVSTAARYDATPTVTNGAYAAGNDIGGLVSFTLARNASGLLQSVGIQFQGGATTTIYAYCFDANPASSTFTDKGTFSIAAADEAKQINKTGIALTPSVASNSGTTVTSASLDQYAQPFNATGTIYCAYATSGIFTPASPTDMRANIKLVQSAQ